MIGITSFGGYVPRLRLLRQCAGDAAGHFSPELADLLQNGERSVCSFDEDTVTMAEEASRACLAGRSCKEVDAVYLCSTTLPFADRQNAVVLKTALGLGERLLTADFTGSLRAGTTGLISALSSVQSGHVKSALIAASDKRLARPGSPEELRFGDGAAAFLVGDTEVLAEYLCSLSIARDVVDHYRKFDRSVDYKWEDRWSLEAGFVPLVKEAVSSLLEELGLAVEDVDLFVIPAPTALAHAKIARALGAAPDRMAAHLLDEVGDTGAAHALLMLAKALETAQGGQTIVCTGLGGGCDALCFRTADDIEKRRLSSAFVSRAIANRESLTHYTRFLSFRGLLPIEQGIRGEAQSKTALSVLFRERDMLLGLMGGRCAVCGTPQFPKSRVCVNPSCRKIDTQTPYSFADKEARVRTFTADYLGPSKNPPNLYGLIQFDGGGRMQAEFCDCTLEELEVGIQVRMVFRKRYDDEERGLIGYFWKATPLRAGKGAI